MKKTYLLGAFLSLAIAPNVAHAQGFLDRIDSVINKVDQTISSSERAQNSVDRIMNKIPEGEQKAQPQTQPQVQNTQPAAGISSDDEEAILQKAREIEDRKILEAAERIRRQRAANSGNN